MTQGLPQNVITITCVNLLVNLHSLKIQRHKLQPVIQGTMMKMLTVASATACEGSDITLW